MVQTTRLAVSVERAMITFHQVRTGASPDARVHRLRRPLSSVPALDNRPRASTTPVVSDLVSLQYIRPDSRDHLLVGNSDHYQREWTDPDSYVDAMDDNMLFEAISKFTHRFPGFESVGLVTAYVGCYDVTPDYNPVMGSTAVRGLFLCAGFSGHGVQARACCRSTDGRVEHRGQRTPCPTWIRRTSGSSASPMLPCSRARIHTWARRRRGSRAGWSATEAFGTARQADVPRTDTRRWYRWASPPILERKRRCLDARRHW